MLMNISTIRKAIIAIGPRLGRSEFTDHRSFRIMRDLWKEKVGLYLKMNKDYPEFLEEMIESFGPGDFASDWKKTRAKERTVADIFYNRK